MFMMMREAGGEVISENEKSTTARFIYVASYGRFQSVEHIIYFRGNGLNNNS